MQARARWHSPVVLTECIANQSFYICIFIVEVDLERYESKDMTRNLCSCVWLLVVNHLHHTVVQLCNFYWSVWLCFGSDARMLIVAQVLSFQDFVAFSPMPQCGVSPFRASCELRGMPPLP